MKIHKKNVVHRDLKTENLLLTQDFDVKICDFGCSALIIPQEYPHFNKINSPPLSIGSPEYNPPEIRKGSIRNTKEEVISSEVFNLGCILFLMVKSD